MPERIKNLLGRTAVLIAGASAVALSCMAQVPVPTEHNDNARSGLNSQETILNTTNVNVNQFGKLYSRALDGQVQAQPLYIPNVTFPGNVMHDVVIVATENDSVYAFDADSIAGANATYLWKANLLDAAHGAGANESTFVSSTIPACTDITPQIGITGTPVVDTTTSPPSIYVEASSQNGNTYIHRLHALNITTGAELSQGPVVITASVSGTGDESQNGVLQLDPLQVFNHSGLLLLNGIVYVPFGSHCDYSPWHGWLLAYNAKTFRQTSVFATTPNAGEGGIWMSGAAPAADSNGYIYLSTGNGVFDSSTTPVTDYGDTLLKLATVDGNGNNGILSVADYFTPFDQLTMYETNIELGSGGVLLLPDQPGTYPHLLVEIPKTGRVYLINRDQMTSNPSNPGQPEHYCSTCTTGDNQIVEESVASYVAGVFGLPAYWNGNVYLWGIHNPLMSIPLSNGLLNFSSPTSGNVSPGFPGGVPAVTANGTTSGTAIVWADTKNGLYAYNAENVSQELWDSTQDPNGRDKPGGYEKYMVPTVSNGIVYLGASGELDVYGLLPLVKPSTTTLGPSQTQQFTATASGVTWSISPTGMGNISTNGLYTAPASIPSSTTVTVTASSAATGLSATATVQLNPSAAGAATASFVKTDTVTQGNWMGAYGADGYSLAGAGQSLPTYDQALSENAPAWTWAASTTDPRGLQLSSGAGRIAAGWYGPTFSFDVNITDGKTHQVALYLLDWDNQGRGETIQIQDANSKLVLDQEFAYSFSNGTFLVWNVSGHVTITLTVDAGPNAVVSGIFFGGGGSTAPVAKVSFVGPVTGTGGNWIGTYGGDGYWIAPNYQSTPSYASITGVNLLTWTWASPTTDTRGLQVPPGGSTRIAATWDNNPSFSFSLNLNDGNSHEIVLYAIDWDSQGRTETIQILDAATSTVLSTQNLSNFSGGVYLVWNITGNVQIVVTLASGPNAVLSGIFFGGGSSGNPSTPSLSITKSHSGNFTQGQQGATYTVTVSNAANAAATSGAVTVAETVPSGLTLVSMAGTNWTCTISTSSCTRSDSLAAGGSYQPITVTVNVGASASSPQVNQVSVSGGGSAAANASDSTTISPVNTGSAVATFLGNDTKTQGSWQGVYGTDGYNIAGSAQSLPAYATTGISSQAEWTWMNPTTDVRGMQVPGGLTRIASTWYGTPGFTFSLNVGSSSHRVALYMLDWDNQGRNETIQINDANSGTLLDSESISGFSGGVYLVWNITGSVQITVKWTGGPNCVISGVFFGGSGIGGGGGTPSSVATFTGTDTTTEGAWPGVHGSHGYAIAGVGQSFSIPVTTTVQSISSWTWAASTTDPRALQLPGGGGAIAATWYTTPAFSFSLSLTDGLQHQVSLYLLDWDNKGRAESIQITDANSGAVLDTRSIPGANTSTTSTNFVNGTYLKWNITGSVNITITSSSGPNAVLSAVFFD